MQSIFKALRRDASGLLLLYLESIAEMTQNAALLRVDPQQPISNVKQAIHYDRATPINNACNAAIHAASNTSARAQLSAAHNRALNANFF